MKIYSLTHPAAPPPPAQPSLLTPSPIRALDPQPSAHNTYNSHTTDTSYTRVLHLAYLALVGVACRVAINFSHFPPPRRLSFIIH